jgi:serine protease Do
MVKLTRTVSRWRSHLGAANTALLAGWCLSCQAASGQDSFDSRLQLSRDYFKSGDKTLRAFAAIAKAARHSVVKLDVDGTTVALGTVVDANGLALTKASEITDGKLTCWLPGGREVPAQIISVDAENDLALVRVKARGLRPIVWADNTVSVGQWAVTPGIEETPQAVGIVSVLPRKILHKRAIIGVRLDSNSNAAKIAEVFEGLGAQKAGLKPGDVIVALNGSPLKEGQELIKQLRKFREGQLVRLRLQREQQQLDAAVQMMLPKSGTPWAFSDRAERMNRLGSELSDRAEGFELALEHDTVLQAWQCGGPLVNLEGKAIGLNIARAARVASYALTPEVIRPIIAALKKQASALGNQKSAQPVSAPGPAIE